MKRISFALSFLLLVSAANAQDTSKDDVAIVQSAFGKDKGELIKQYMAVPADKAAAFTAVYEKYEEARRAIGRKKLTLIQDYANAYTALDDKKTDELFKRKIALADEFSALQKKYYPEIAKILGARQAGKFFQLEDYINNVINLAIQENIPFIDELNDTKTIKQ
jgi:hypothetical protein